MTQQHVRRPPSTPSPAGPWSDLPLDVLSYIFAKLGAVDVLMGPGLACRSWLDAAKAPHLYRHVDMEFHEVVRKKMDNPDVLRSMAKMAVDR